jgi:5-hydroxyisourate hydrolase-like protein (transthyretin family)
MVSSSRQAFACILLVLAATSFAHAQKDQTASISGKVTLKNKGIAGIVVVAFATNYGSDWQSTRYRGASDAEGNYRIENVPSGSYYVSPIPLAFAVDKAQAKQLLVVAAGETIHDVDFALVRGGVITGKIRGADGLPLIEVIVNVTPVDAQPDYQPHVFSFQTDDRGVYRVFGLRQGKYKVSVGASRDRLPGQSRQIFKQTFYPSVTDPEKADILEVSEGGELRNVDIEVELPVATFKVSGRIIDGETGKPLANVQFGVEREDGNFSVSSVGGVSSNKNGEFKLENVTPGQYRVFAALSDKDEWRADPLAFDVVDADVNGLEIKTKRGTSLSGVVVLQNSDEKSGTPKVHQLQIYASLENPATQSNGGYTARVAPDGSFKIRGLVAGHAELAVFMENRIGSKQIETVSVEQDGVPQPKGFDLKDGEQVSGIRIVARYKNFTGAIHGQVNFEDGELPPGSQVLVSVSLLGEKPSRAVFGPPGHSPRVDSRGRFIVGPLEPGIYEVSVLVFPVGRARYDVPKQQVTVTNNTVSDVTISVKVKP